MRFSAMQEDGWDREVAASAIRDLGPLGGYYAQALALKIEDEEIRGFLRAFREHGPAALMCEIAGGALSYEIGFENGMVMLLKMQEAGLHLPLPPLTGELN